MEILQSFRYKQVNVIFATPSARYIDIAVRQRVHYLLNMEYRTETHAVATVYKILKPTWKGEPWRKKMGVLYIQPPTQQLWRKFEKLRDQHQEALYEKIRKRQKKEAVEEEQKLEEASRGKLSFEEGVDLLRKNLPKYLNPEKMKKKWSGAIKVSKFMRDFDIKQNTAYNIRDAIIEELKTKKALESSESEEKV